MFGQQPAWLKLDAAGHGLIEPAGIRLKHYNVAHCAFRKDEYYSSHIFPMLILSVRVHSS
jgi:hypothetical protein